MLERLTTESFTKPCIDIYPSSFTESEKNRVMSMKQSDTGGLASDLKLKVGARIMLISNIDIDDRLINGQLGTITHYQSNNGRVEIIYIKFDDAKAGQMKQARNRYAIETQSIPIERTEANFSLNKRKSNTGPMVKRTQFPLMLSYACTVHKVQGLTLDQAVISFDLRKQRSFNPGQMYVAMSRVKTIEGLFFTGEFKKNAFTCNHKVDEEYCRLRMKDNQVCAIKDFMLSEGCLNVCLLNIRSLSRHAIDIQEDYFLKNNDLLCLTETQISFNHNNTPMEDIDNILNNYTVSYNNDQHRFNSMAICHETDLVNVLEYDHTPGFSLVKFKKDLFSEKVFCLLLLYKNTKTSSHDFAYQLLNFLRENSIDIILGDFNIDGFDENALLNEVLIDYQLQIDFPTHLDGAMLDHIYVHKDLLTDFNVETIRKCVNISDHDGIKMKLTKRQRTINIPIG